MRCVRDENKQHPLGDQELVDLLQGNGIRVARRTIAKYRDQLKILPAALRRQ